MSSFTEAKHSASRRVRSWIWQGAAWWNGRRSGYVREPARLYRLPPERIRFIVRDQRRVANVYGRILGGDWDVRSGEFEKSLVYRALRERFVEGREWESTRFYARVLEEIEAGAVRWDCRSASEWQQRLAEVDRLFARIRRDGYRTQAELGTLQPWGEIKLCVDRYGEALFVDGRHRLGIAKLLALPSVPVIVTAWHRDALGAAPPEAVIARLQS